MLARAPRLAPRIVRSFSRAQVLPKKPAFRPRSPSLGTMPLDHVAISSVSIRMTSCVIAGLTCGMGGLYLAGIDTPEIIKNTMMKLEEKKLGCVARFTVAFPFVFHFLGMARHKMFTMTSGYGLGSMKAINASSLALIGSAFVLSAALASVKIPVKEEAPVKEE